ncbi:MAG: maleylpyruvate isomerase N-terminal domain-containing protein [Actinobacteria bacterium]|nr:maleylpyruvate isomerase N-terminal domain-containing protein [Actinomycetota bacterium]
MDLSGGHMVASRWTDPMDAVEVVAGRMADLVRSLPDERSDALGVWDSLELATHATHVFEFAADVVGGGEPPLDDIRRLGDFTRDMVDRDPERDPQVLARRIEMATARLIGALSSGPPRDVRWLGGIEVPVSLLPGHLLSETLLHGADLAAAVGGSWKIESAHALVAVRDFLFPILQRLDPEFLLTERGRAARTSYEVRAPGAGAIRLDFGHGTVVVGPASGRPVDCRIWGEPAALLQVVFGRTSQWRAIVGGRLVAWGRKPWLAPQLTSLVRSP